MYKRASKRANTLKLHWIIDEFSTWIVIISIAIPLLPLHQLTSEENQKNVSPFLFTILFRSNLWLYFYWLYTGWFSQFVAAACLLSTMSFKVSGFDWMRQTCCRQTFIDSIIRFQIFRQFKTLFDTTKNHSKDDAVCSFIACTRSLHLFSVTLYIIWYLYKCKLKWSVHKLNHCNRIFKRSDCNHLINAMFFTIQDQLFASI